MSVECTVGLEFVPVESTNEHVVCSGTIGSCHVNVIGSFDDNSHIMVCDAVSSVWVTTCEPLDYHCTHLACLPMSNGTI